MKKLTSILGNSQKLDGGAMFGHVPKTLWGKWFTPDDKNRISLACRALLIQEENRNILLEAGVGAFFDPTLRERYGIEATHHVLLESLKKVGLSDSDIDVVILSHLHFDHVGGLLSEWRSGESLKLLFPNAKFLVGQEAWNRAINPHLRDQASFVPELNSLLETSGRLVIVDGKSCDLLGDDYHFLYTEGHTPGLMHTVIATREGPIVFASDLIPGTSWVHVPVGMGYDRFAEVLCDEKNTLLEWCQKNNARLFFTHDPKVAIATVVREASGKFKVENEEEALVEKQG
jgi:glyoxylase-like metal-dependent hydrolase (beta-lactamase superfamily II)